jgi:protein involved in polysaccharide export with SLBB domain
VGGEVRQPNLYMLRPETTITQAVMQAGGPAANGRIDRVRLLRGSETFVIDLTRPYEGLAQAPISSGDQLFVGRRVSFVREYVAPFSSILSAAVSVAWLVNRYF